MKKTNVLCMIIVTVMLMGLFSGCAQKKTEISTKFADQTYLQPLIPTGRLFRYNWDSPSEIKPDDLVNFAAYNNLLELPTEPAGQKICDGASYIDNMAPAEQLEEAVLQYFSVDAQQLRQSQFYHPDRNTYTMLCGFGGGYGMQLMGGYTEGEMMYLQVGEGGVEEQPVYTGTLKIKQIDESNWKYVSYQKENWSYIGETLSVRK